MLYDNTNIICLLKGQEKAPLIGFPDSLFYRTPSTAPRFKELPGKLVLSRTNFVVFDQHCDVKVTEKASVPLKATLFFFALCSINNV